MPMRAPWGGTEQFTWGEYPAALHPAIVRSRYQAERLQRCSVCGKRRVVWGVWLHPALKQVEPPPGLQPRPYALCVAHRGLTAEAIGQALAG